MEQLTPWNFECCLAHSDFCATTKTLITYLSAATSAAEDFLFLRYVNVLVIIIIIIIIMCRMGR